MPEQQATLLQSDPHPICCICGGVGTRILPTTLGERTFCDKHEPNFPCRYCGAMNVANHQPGCPGQSVDPPTPRCPENAPRNDKWVAPSGATSSKNLPGFDMIPVEALIELAKRYDVGLAKHGRDNWRKGLTDEEWLRDRFNHTLTHLYDGWAKAYGRFELPSEMTAIEDFAAVAWGAFTLICAMKARK